jgi:predicted  nucleic acid-binding Zn-ribbon protein
MAKELTVAEKLKQLYKLQTIDSKLDEIKIMKGELPMEVQDLEDDIAGLNTRINRIKYSLEEIGDEISNHNANIKESEKLIAKYTKQLDDVKNNREFDALNKEIELQKLEIQLSEKKIKEAKFNEEKKNDNLASVEEKLKAREEDLERKKTELSNILVKTEKEEEKLLKASVSARKGIDDRLLKSYDRTRKNYRNGIAVATLTRESCGGCFNKIPPQVQIDIGVMQNIIACEHCGRILVDENFVNPSDK